jgi:NDP-sugar pyrophosphorylase family protein
MQNPSPSSPIMNNPIEFTTTSTSERIQKLESKVLDMEEFIATQLYLILNVEFRTMLQEKKSSPLSDIDMQRYFVVRQKLKSSIHDFILKKQRERDEERFNNLIPKALVQKKKKKDE